jgi:hypothetical protein
MILYFDVQQGKIALPIMYDFSDVLLTFYLINIMSFRTSFLAFTHDLLILSDFIENTSNIDILETNLSFI